MSEYITEAVDFIITETGTRLVTEDHIDAADRIMGSLAGAGGLAGQGGIAGQGGGLAA